MARVNGTSGDDVLDGTDGNDILNGFAGNDTINGSLGDDIAFGGRGFDTFILGTGVDHFDGGAGIDTIKVDLSSFQDDQFRLSVNMQTGQFNNSLGVREDTFENIERFVLFGDTKIDTEILGDSKNNRFVSSNGNDVLNGAGGDDWLDGGRGDDILRGGDGNDVFVIGTGVDHFDGGAGVDNIQVDLSSFQDDQFTLSFDMRTGEITNSLGVGEDTLENIENVLLFGDRKIDTQILGDNQANNFSTSNGNDVLNGAGGIDTLDGGRGDDILRGGKGNDNLIIGTGADHFDGGAGIDSIFVRLSSFQDDQFTMSVNMRSGEITNSLGVGEDTIENVERVLLFGNTKIDTEFLGDFKKNEFIASNGNDVLNGAGGNDRLWGGQGNDILKGGSGQDFLVGDLGKDVMTGGRGFDEFVFRSHVASGIRTNERDVITDFSTSDEEKINLSQIDAKTGRLNQAFDFIGETAFSGSKGELRYEKKANKTIIEADRNGDRVADFAIEISKVMDLQEGDFIL